MAETGKKFVVRCPGCRKCYRLGPAAVGKLAKCACGQTFKVPDPQKHRSDLRPSPAAKPRSSGATRSVSPRSPSTGRPAGRDGLPAAGAASLPSTPAPGVNTPDVDPLFDAGQSAAPLPSFTAPAAAAPSPWQSTPLNAYAPPGIVGQQCQQHPGAPIIAACQLCQKPVCGTCAFQFPGGLTYCPACATSSHYPLSPLRKYQVIAAMVLAGWSTLMGVFLCSGAFASLAEAPLGGLVIEVLAVHPVIVGIGLSCGSFCAREGNSAVVWGAAVWNVVMAVGWTLLAILGLAAGGA